MGSAFGLQLFSIYTTIGNSTCQLYATKSQLLHIRFLSDFSPKFQTHIFTASTWMSNRCHNSTCPKLTSDLSAKAALSFPFPGWWQLQPSSFSDQNPWSHLNSTLSPISYFQNALEKKFYCLYFQDTSRIQPLLITSSATVLVQAMTTSFLIRALAS